jgi:signal peptidase I
MGNDVINQSNSFYLTPEPESKVKIFLRRIFSRIGCVFQVLVILVCVLALLYLFIFPVNIVNGRSMDPNFCSNDVYLTYKLNMYFSDQPLQVGNVIAFKHSEGSYFIKRVIGIPGDEIMILNGKVYRNGLVLEEPYLPDGRYTATKPGGFINEGEVVKIPKGKYFVLGDNRQHSMDSRDFGPIDLLANEINGHVVFVIWPLSRMRFFSENQAFPENECTNIN